VPSGKRPCRKTSNGRYAQQGARLDSQEASEAERGLSKVEYIVLQAVRDISAGMPTVDVTQEAVARKAGLDHESEEASEAMVALMDSGYVKGTNVLGQRVYRIPASGIEESTRPE
jgi:hypothetical protein